MGPRLRNITFTAGLIVGKSKVQGTSSLQNKATNPFDSRTACKTGLMTG